MTKYYTPEIEEFHVGFEYEIENDPVNGIWSKETVDKWSIGDLVKCLEKSDADYRVKHLDREDIESLGFEHMKTHPGTTESYYEGRGILEEYGIDHDHESGYFRIYTWGHEGDNTMFSGSLRNKSELKRILKQIGVL